MTRLLFLSTLTVIASLLVFGCSDEGALTRALQEDAAGLNGPVIAASQHGPPPSSGPNVSRYEGSFTLFFVDPETGVSAYFGGDLVALCSGDPEGFAPVAIQEVNVPEDANRFMQLVKARDVPASLWDPAPANCAEVLAGSPVATGYGDFVSNDNDVLIFLNPESKNANAFGGNARAVMETPGGETLRVNAHWRCRWDGNDPATITCTEKVNVQ